MPTRVTDPKAEVVISPLPGRKGTYLCIQVGAQCFPIAKFMELKHYSGLSKFREWVKSRHGSTLVFEEDSWPEG